MGGGGGGGGDAGGGAPDVENAERLRKFGTLSDIASVGVKEATAVFSNASAELLKARAGGVDTDMSEAALATMLLRWITASMSP